MKAIILAAGIGSRIRPLTNNCPKSLLKVGGKTILEMMLSHIRDCGIHEVVFVLGYLEDKIKTYVKETFPDLKVYFINNKHYAETNTGFSLMLAIQTINNSDFIKFDADVIFDKEILKKLIRSPYDNCLCIDKNIDLNTEEIKVIIDEKSLVVKASKAVDAKKAIGESVGIEKISSETAKSLLIELRLMMQDHKNYQEYYEEAYERLIARNIPFNIVDITGLKWTEIDTKEDFVLAEEIFNLKQAE